LTKYINQRGYALLIVMLTIIIFLSLSAVFLSASFSHVKQEETVDLNNQAFVAAEMGAKVISTDIENILKLRIKDMENKVLLLQSEITSCEVSKTCNITTLKNDIAKLEEDEINGFNTFINNTNSFNPEDSLKAYIENRYKEFKLSSTNQFKLKVDTNQKTIYDVIPQNESYKITTYVVGNTSENHSKEIEIEFEIGKLNNLFSENSTRSVILSKEVVTPNQFKIMPEETIENCNLSF